MNDPHPTTDESTLAGDSRQELIAYYASLGPAIRLAPAPRWRQWMNETADRWANRCLPLLVANEAGWVLLNPVAFEATWDGDPRPEGVKIEFAAAAGPPVTHAVESHFGYGIITWGVPYLFRTPPGYNLLARGPANWPKDGICALEGLVETDWSVATFTMNWKLTRPGLAVSFEADEPFCMVVPQRRGELEGFSPVARQITSEPQVAEATNAWVDSRHEAQVRKFLSQYSREYEDERAAWQRHYFKGTAPDGTEAPVHQTQLRLPDFRVENG